MTSRVMSAGTTKLGEFLERARKGDLWAAREFFRLCRRRLVGLANKVWQNNKPPRGDCGPSDLVQMAALSLVGRLERGEIDNPAGFFRFAATIFKNKLVDLFRRSKRRAEVEAAVRPCPPKAGTEFPSQGVEDVRVALSLLTPEDRKIAEMKWGRGETMAEMAKEFAVTERTMRRWCEQIREELKATLGKLRPELAEKKDNAREQPAPVVADCAGDPAVRPAECPGGL